MRLAVTHNIASAVPSGSIASYPEHKSIHVSHLITFTSYVHQYLSDYSWISEIDLPPTSCARQTFHFHRIAQ
jgi:hypothetical protein